MHRIFSSSTPLDLYANLGMKKPSEGTEGDGYGTWQVSSLPLREARTRRLPLRPREQETLTRHLLVKDEFF